MSSTRSSGRGQKTFAKKVNFFVRDLWLISLSRRRKRESGMVVQYDGYLLPSSHGDGPGKHVDLVKTSLLKPTLHLRAGLLPLVPGRVPIEGIEHAPLRVR